jgi:glycosyltransferase involved in cell wall biosynthesis
MHKLVSIVLPVYNQAAYLPAALDSVFAQTYPHFELIVVNDGSTDATFETLTEYQKKYTFKVIHQENQKLPSSLNNGFAVAVGDYLTWTSSDNLMEPEMLATLVNALDRDPKVGLVYADCHLMNDAGQDLGRYNMPDYDYYLLMHTNLVHCCFLYRRECQRQVGDYDPEFIYGEDWEYWIRLSRQFAMKHIPESLYWYRVHKSSMTSELMRGTAKHLSWHEFSRRTRNRQPLRWWIGKIRWGIMKRLHSGHPAIVQRKEWYRATVEAAK